MSCWSIYIRLALWKKILVVRWSIENSHSEGSWRRFYVGAGDDVEEKVLAVLKSFEICYSVDFEYASFNTSRVTKKCFLFKYNCAHVYAFLCNNIVLTKFLSKLIIPVQCPYYESYQRKNSLLTPFLGGRFMTRVSVFSVSSLMYIYYHQNGEKCTHFFFRCGN